jgi:tetratricopeptide (TPR) repeat protein
MSSVNFFTTKRRLLLFQQAPQVPETQAQDVFDRTVGLVRRVRGDWDAFQEPINTLLTLPDPWSRIGGAEVVLRLSYLEWQSFAPEGLRFALGQVNTVLREYSLQPDALVIRVKLLAGRPDREWLVLAGETLELLKYYAPQPPRLPDAEASLRLQQGDNTGALECLERTIAHPPDSDEAFAAQATRATVLMNMGRFDEALHAYDAVLTADPRDPWTWHNKSLLLIRLNRYQEALECNTRALEIMRFSNAESTRQHILGALQANT